MTAVRKPDFDIRLAIARQLALVFPVARRFIKGVDKGGPPAGLVAVLDEWPGFWAETTRFWLLEQACELLLADDPELRKKVEARVGTGGNCSPEMLVRRLSYRTAFEIFQHRTAPDDLRDQYKEWRRNAKALENAESGQCDFTCFAALKAILEDFLLPYEEVVLRLKCKYLPPASSRPQ